MYTLLLIMRSSVLNRNDYINLINLLTWSGYQTMPILLAIYYASKTTEYVSTNFQELISKRDSLKILILKGKQMHSIVGKIINSSDDYEVLNRVTIVLSNCIQFTNSKFIVEALYHANVKSSASIKLWLLSY